VIGNFVLQAKGTSPTAWQRRYSCAVQSATSSDSHKATSAVVQLLRHVENCFKLFAVRTLYKLYQQRTGVPDSASGRCGWMLYELLSGYRVWFWRWLVAQPAQIAAKLTALQAVIFIFRISLQRKYSDHKVNGNLSNHRKHTMCLYLNFSRQISEKSVQYKISRKPIQWKHTFSARETNREAWRSWYSIHLTLPRFQRRNFEIRITFNLHRKSLI
jgi:hypothetical protein